MFARPFADFDPGPEELPATGSVREIVVGRVRRCIDGRCASPATRPTSRMYCSRWPRAWRRRRPPAGSAGRGLDGSALGAGPADSARRPGTASIHCGLIHSRCSTREFRGCACRNVCRCRWCDGLLASGFDRSSYSPDPVRALCHGISSARGRWRSRCSRSPPARLHPALDSDAGSDDQQPGPSAGPDRAAARATTIVPGSGSAELALAPAARCSPAPPRSFWSGPRPGEPAGRGDHGGGPRHPAAPHATGGSGAVELAGDRRHAPGGALRAELARLGAGTIVTVGASAAGWEGAAPTATPTVAVSPSDLDGAPLDGVLPPAPLRQLLVLALDGPASAAAQATARAAGARVLAMAGADPRSSSATIKALAAQPPTTVLALSAPRSARRPRCATGSTPRPPASSCPGGGQVVFPGPPDGRHVRAPGRRRPRRARRAAARRRAIARARKRRRGLQRSGRRAGRAGVRDHRDRGVGHPRLRRQLLQRVRRRTLKPWVDAARAGRHLRRARPAARPGRLPDQAKLYANLLLEPNVGLALDPEWRLRPDQRPADSRSAASTRPRSTRSAAGWPTSPGKPPAAEAVHGAPVPARHDLRRRAGDRLDSCASHPCRRLRARRGRRTSTWNALHVARRPSAVGLEELLRRGQADLHARSRPWPTSPRRSSSPTNDPRCVHRCLGGVRGHGRPGLVITRIARPRPHSSAPAAPDGLRG